MPKYRVEITNIAETDIRDIYEYISKDNKSAANKWIDEIEHQVHTLKQFPLRCPAIPETQDLGREYRHIIYGNYRTLFRVEKSKVIILRVIHGVRLLDMQIFEK